MKAFYDRIGIKEKNMKLKWIAGILCFSLLFAPGFTIANMSQAQLEEAEQKLKTLKKRIKKLEKTAKRNKKTARKNMKFLTKLDDKLRINGYITAGTAISDTDSSFGGGVNKSTATEFDSLAGMQMTFSLDKETQFVTQLVTYLGANPEVLTEWAYLSYKLQDNLKVRGGRVVAPLYFFSEFVNAGFAHPWARPPREVYFLGSSAADGFDLLYDKEIWGWSTSWQALISIQYAPGAFNDINSEVTFRDAFTFNSTWVKGAWTLRGAVSKGNFGFTFTPYQTLDESIALLESISGVEIAEPFNGYEKPIAYTSFGVEYNDGNFYGLFEYTYANFWDSPIVTPDQMQGFVTLGYRFGKYLPYVSVAKAYTTGDSDDKLREVADAMDEAGVAMQGVKAGLDFLSATLDAAATDLDNGLTKATSVNYQTALAITQSSPTLASFAELLGGNPNGFDLRLLNLGLAEQSAQLQSGIDGVPAAGALFRSLVSQQTSYTVGVRYDWSSKVAVKAEVSQYENFAGAPGRFDSYPGKKVNLFTFVIHAVF